MNLSFFFYIIVIDWFVITFILLVLDTIFIESMLHSVIFIIICVEFHINYVTILTLMTVYYYCLINFVSINVINHWLIINFSGNYPFD